MAFVMAYLFGCVVSLVVALLAMRHGGTFQVSDLGFLLTFIFLHPYYLWVWLRLQYWTFRLWVQRRND